MTPKVPRPHRIPSSVQRLADPVTYLVRQADFVACHNPAYLHKYNMVQEVKDGGIFLLNCYYKEEELEQYLPVRSNAISRSIRLSCM